MLIKNTEHSVNIEDMNHFGYGVARIDGIAVFVPGAAVGDVARIKIIKTTKNYAVGKLLAVEVPSKNRSPKDQCCPAANRCGGCNYQHILYETELSQKQKEVLFALRKEGFRNITIEPCKNTGKIDFYRNKAQYPVGCDSNGKIVAGFYKTKSHEIIADCPCRLSPHIFSEIVTETIRFLNEFHITAYDETSHRGLVRHIYLRSSGDGGEILLCLVINGTKLPQSETLISRLQAQFPQIVGVVLNSNTQPTNIILGNHTQTLWGRDYIYDTLCGLRFKISAHSFYQVNHDGAEILFNTARELLSVSDEDILLDLYCGIGAVGMIVGQKAKELIGIEIVPDAVKNANENAKANGFKNASFFCANAADAKALLRDKHITTASVDPPRSGLDRNLIDYIAEIAPKRILYISCNPSTLARDLRYFSEHGYSTDTVYPVDMFPRTGHVECICILKHA